MINENNIQTEPKILVISNNAFSTTNNNGKTLASFFKHFPSENVAQLFFKDELPTDNSYSNYFRITDLEMLRGVVLNEKPGSVVQGSKINIYNCTKYQNGLDSYNLGNFNVFRIGRELLWKNSIWKTKKLDRWLDEFSPNVIFLCAGDTGFVYNITNYIQKRHSTKLITYMTDDYILPRKTLSPFWWIRRNFILRKMRDMVKKSDLFITISEEMRNTYREIFKVDSIIAMNMSESLHDESIFSKKDNKEIVELVYAGGLHLKRYETLITLAKAIEKFNKNNEQKVHLRIFSSVVPSKNIIKKLEISNASKYCGSLNREQLKCVLNKCDILVHVESFDNRSIESTRLSISTKITEYLSLGKTILAIGPSEIASMKYLIDTAYCIINPDRIDNELSELLRNVELRERLAYEARRKYKKYYNNDKIYISIEKLLKL